MKEKLWELLPLPILIPGVFISFLIIGWAVNKILGFINDL